MNLKWLSFLAVAFGVQGAAPPQAPTEAPPAHEPAARAPSVPDALAGQRVYTSTAVIDDLLLDGETLYAAGPGGLAQIRVATRERRVFTQADGLAETHVKRVVRDARGIVALTETHACILASPIVCSPTPHPPSPSGGGSGRGSGPPSVDGWRITSRADTPTGSFIGSAGGGIYWQGNGAPPTRLAWDDELADPFVHDLVAFRGELWIAGFSNGTSILSHGHIRAAITPFRYPNRMLAASGTLFVAANEGLFFTRDGVRFERVDAIEQRGVNGLAYDGERLLVTVPAAFYQLRLDRRGPTIVRSVYRPAGTRALQAVTVSGKRVYLASEDRGIIAVDGQTFTAWDRLSGLPTSWMLDVASDGSGGVFGATLRHGVVHLDAQGHVSAPPSPATWTLRVEDTTHGLWVGTQRGMTQTAATQGLHLPDERVHARLEYDGKTYFGTEAGLLEMAGAGGG